MRWQTQVFPFHFCCSRVIFSSPSSHLHRRPPPSFPTHTSQTTREIHINTLRRESGGKKRNGWNTRCGGRQERVSHGVVALPLSLLSLSFRSSVIEMRRTTRLCMAVSSRPSCFPTSSRVFPLRRRRRSKFGREGPLRWRQRSRAWFARGLSFGGGGVDIATKDMSIPS